MEVAATIAASAVIQVDVYCVICIYIHRRLTNG